MGQYHFLVNVTKRQFVHPHKLGCGLKLGEQTGHNSTVSAALMLLLAVSNGRGGGDFHSDSPLIGSWGGDRIAVIGDYADDADLPEEFKASTIYALCNYGDALAKGETEYIADYEKDGLTPDQAYVDISDQLVPLLSEVLGVFICGEGWRRSFDLWDISGLEMTHLNIGTNKRVARINGKDYLYDDVADEIKRMVKEDKRGGYGVSLKDLDVSKLSPV